MISSHRILIIDDDLDILELLEYNLHREGYEVQCLNDPRRSLEYAQEFNPTLIILDAVMPEVDGFSVCKQFRSSHSFENISIFMLTALVESHYEKMAFGSGADDFIHKMLGLRSLTKRIELVLRKKLIIQKRFDRLEIGGWKIIRGENLVIKNNRRVKLLPEEFEVFYFIAQNAHRTLTHDHVLQVTSGSNLFQHHFSIEKCMEGLMWKLGIHWIVPKGRNGFKLNIE